MQDSDSYTDHRPESEATNSSEKASPVKLVALSTAAFVLAIVAFVGVTFVQVWFQSMRDEIKSADAIVVLGAAQWDGIPSPVLKARLDHALDLYAKELAPFNAYINAYIIALVAKLRQVALGTQKEHATWK